ncbi:GTPase-associated protein 1-related protein [Streptomyces sp. SID3343]|uniref:GTPase-associated protein 1-related protein n=1 Tax=Streptomyces sp. SID3343 TaxID=2690260 RepID=UPI00136FFE09|nr:GTPase-associated protein 1-related protein [Streptomyces sp. SID3343]MYW05334.1 hypothetical protein [Streptomyces sp. SID3343]
MTIRQMHYSSVEHGPGGGSGFQFTSIDPDVDAGTRGHIEQLLRYEPPDGLATVPTATELAAFPISFSHTRLPTGAAVLCRTRYVGQDYSGRQGNFHAHALYAHDGRFGRAPWESAWSPLWRDELPTGGAATTLDELPAGTAPSPARLAEFAARHKDRLAPFLADVFRLFGDGDARQIIVCEGDPKDILYWIALATASLEPAQAQRLTFTSYTRRPYLAVQQIVGIAPGSDFAYSDTEVNHQYRVHGSAARHTSPPSTDARSRQFAQLWATGETTAVAELAAGHPDAPGGPESADQAGRWAAIDLSKGRIDDVDHAVRWLRGHIGDGEPSFWAGVAATLVAHEDKLSEETLGIVVETLGPELPAAERDELGVTAIVRMSQHGDFGSPDEIDRAIRDPAALERLNRAMHSTMERRIGELTHGRRRGEPGAAARTLRMGDRFGVDYGNAFVKLADLLASDLLTEDLDTLDFLKGTRHVKLRDFVLDELDQREAGHRPEVRELLARGEFAEFVRDRAGARHRLWMTARGQLARARGVTGDRALFGEVWRRDFPDEQRVELVRHAVRIMCDGEQLTLDGAMGLLTEVPTADLRAAGLAAELQEPVRQDSEPGPNTFLFANELERRKIGELTPETQLVCLLGTLRDGGPRNLVVKETVELIRRISTRPVLASTARKAVIDYLLARRSPPAFTNELELSALAHSGDDELVGLYRKGVSDSDWRRGTTLTPQTAARWFVALRKADTHASPASSWHAVRSRIEKDALVKIAQDGRQADMVELGAHEVARLSGDALAREWRTLFEKRGILNKFRSGRGSQPDPVPPSPGHASDAGPTHPRPHWRGPQPPRGDS